jgi:hypothetical protein
VTAPTRPLRIAVMASSVGYYVRPYAQSGLSRPYPEELEDLLRAGGVEAEVFNHSRWFALVHEAFRNIQSYVVPHGVDVAIVNFGLLESESTIMPTSLVRRMYRWDPPTNAVWAPARRALLRPVHRFYKDIAPAIMERVPAFHRLSPGRFAQELTRTVRWLRKERNALVLVLNINPIGDNVEKTMPGTTRSAAAYNAIIENVVRSQCDDQVRLVDVHSMVADGNEGGRLVADGIHYTAEGHRAVAEMIAAEIGCWLKAKR